MTNTPLKNEGVTPPNTNEYTTEAREELASTPVNDIAPEAWSVMGHTKIPLLKVIRRRCIDCCAYNIREVNKCPAVECPSWPYRTGKNPFRKKGGNHA